LRSNTTNGSSVRHVRCKSTDKDSTGNISAVINGSDASSEDDTQTSRHSHRRPAADDSNGEDVSDELIGAFDMSAINDDWEDELFCRRLDRFCHFSGDAQECLDAEDAPTVTYELPQGNFRCVVTDFATESYAPTWTALHDYQRLGCRWLNELWEQGVGGILGDEMGRGTSSLLILHDFPIINIVGIVHRIG